MSQNYIFTKLIYTFVVPFYLACKLQSVYLNASTDILRIFKLSFCPLVILSYPLRKCRQGAPLCCHERSSEYTQFYSVTGVGDARVSRAQRRCCSGLCRDGNAGPVLQPLEWVMFSVRAMFSHTASPHITCRAGSLSVV